jgi:hypothetical protein
VAQVLLPRGFCLSLRRVRLRLARSFAGKRCVKELWECAQGSPDSIVVAGEQTRILRAATSPENDKVSIQQELNYHYVRQSQ